MSRKLHFVILPLVLLSVLLSACATPAAAPQTVEVVKTVQVEVTKIVAGTPQTVLITTTPEAMPVSAPSNPQLINGAGATFPFPLYSRWFYDYAFVDPAVKFNYQSIGSGGGIKQITEKTVDFGASDAILNDDQYKAAPGIQMFPTVAGAEAIVVNLKGSDGKARCRSDQVPTRRSGRYLFGKDQEME